MRIYAVIAIVVLAAAAVLPSASSAAHAASGLPVVASVQAQDHPGTLDAPHPVGVTETESGAAAAACEIPTGSPRIAEGDFGGGPLAATAGTAVVAAGEAPVTVGTSPADHTEVLDAPHPTGATETLYGAAATECRQLPDTGE
jgi:hypothetical protein